MAEIGFFIFIAFVVSCLFARRMDKIQNDHDEQIRRNNADRFKQRYGK